MVMVELQRRMAAARGRWGRKELRSAGGRPRRMAAGEGGSSAG
jgi:hypothetical protein